MLNIAVNVKIFDTEFMIPNYCHVHEDDRRQVSEIHTYKMRTNCTQAECSDKIHEFGNESSLGLAAASFLLIASVWAKICQMACGYLTTVSTHSYNNVQRTWTVWHGNAFTWISIAKISHISQWQYLVAAVPRYPCLCMRFELLPKIQLIPCSQLSLHGLLAHTQYLLALEISNICLGIAVPTPPSSVPSNRTWWHIIIIIVLY